jgi:hypothetical protein
MGLAKPAIARAQMQAERRLASALKKGHTSLPDVSAQVKEPAGAGLRGLASCCP